MIHFIVGKPRNGKGVLSMMKIVEQLTTTQRYIVTNMVLRLDVLQDYLDDLGHSVHVVDRVKLLDDSGIKDFWLHRETGEIPTLPDYREKNPANVDYSALFSDPRLRVGGKLFDESGNATNFKGTCYVVDEAQTIWRSRGWQGTPVHVDFYLSQHGKLNDVVYIVTQNVKNVDRILYSLAQDYTYCRNHRIETFGRFRGGDYFTAKTYPNPVTNGGEETLNVQKYKLDLELAACYDTSAGVGMPGGGTADASFRAKGISLNWVWVGLAALLAVVCFGITKLVPAMTKKYIAPAIDPAVTGKASAMNFSQPGSPLVNQNASPGVNKSALVNQNASPGVNKPLQVRGYVVRGNSFSLVLTDGRTLTERDGLVSSIERTCVRLKSGERLDFVEIKTPLRRSELDRRFDVKPSALGAPLVPPALAEPSDGGAGLLGANDDISEPVAARSPVRPVGGRPGAAGAGAPRRPL